MAGLVVLFAVEQEVGGIRGHAKPKLVAGVVSQPWTSAVTSSVTYWPAAEAMKMPVVAPMEGRDAAVTDDSVQVDVAGESVTDPAALTRLTKTVSVACEIWLAVVPAFEQIMKFNPTVRTIERKESLRYRGRRGQ